MKLIFDILRRKSKDAEPWHQRVPFATDDDQETVATALLRINSQADYRDEQGSVVETIAWEAGCLQKKCGACAMLIDHQPALACDFFLKNAVTKKKNVITLEPLSKFPVVRDLVTDRTILFEHLKTLRVWSTENAELKEKELDLAYDASRCLQCGCCLEICPNYSPDNLFFGAAGYAPVARLSSTFTDTEQKSSGSLYQKHIYNGCGKALSCIKVCPAKIDLDHLLSRSNAIFIWHRK